MSLMDQATNRPRTSTVKDTLVQWRGYFFPMSMEAKIVCAVLMAVALWVVAIFVFGVPALVLPMMLIVPGLVIGLVLLTLGM